MKTKLVSLYIATHNKTKLKYFGKSSIYLDEDSLQENYHGSGKYWLKHLAKHGDDVRMEIYGVYSIDKVKDVALQFSEDNDIVNSSEWANLKEENGIDGGSHGKSGKDLNYKKISCPHCNKTGIIANIKRYHLNNCKLNPDRGDISFKLSEVSFAKNRQSYKSYVIKYDDGKILTYSCKKELMDNTGLSPTIIQRFIEDPSYIPWANKHKNIISISKEN